ncbi:YbaB/EbfC family nucleoid-associated protein [Cellulomonas palmilytica]|uniref:YbaB/EbfC family nucleoid-associated protein n=1 Tax=Cellulomonas palmilytica TaxID=2608402 RepID=UPI001EEDD274|nr:YbaB/EbfC family nucleoid-associated protein [Cellulomonas palmilytica]UJP39160.1 YbaB/EbfC family nucleoid-associated protein [Cellulomonas palmilytica]
MSGDGPRTGTTSGGFVPQGRRAARPVAQPPAGAHAAPGAATEPGATAAAGRAWHEGATERIAQQVQDAARRAAAAEALRDELAGLTASARSTRGEVRVEVDARGRLVRLALADRATSLPAATLARLVEDTARAAAQRVDASALALVENRLGAGSALLAAMREDLTRAAV